MCICITFNTDYSPEDNAVGAPVTMKPHLNHASLLLDYVIDG